MEKEKKKKKKKKILKEIGCIYAAAVQHTEIMMSAHE